jgi:MOSC domain-containing protein YiiM
MSGQSSSREARMRVIGVQVGTVQPLQVGDGHVLSGIRKHPVQGSVAVTALGLAGDEQADPTVHGGLAKAVYAYPLEHYEFWREYRQSGGLSADLPHGSLGENLTLAGLLESALYVGDMLCFPDCVLRVTQPREPCFKFNAVMDGPNAARAMIRSGYSGFYLAVDTPGTLAAGQEFSVMPGPRQTPLTALLKGNRGG